MIRVTDTQGNAYRLTDDELMAGALWHKISIADVASVCFSDADGSADFTIATDTFINLPLNKYRQRHQIKQVDPPPERRHVTWFGSDAQFALANWR